MQFFFISLREGGFIYPEMVSACVSHRRFFALPNILHFGVNKQLICVVQESEAHCSKKKFFFCLLFLRITSHLLSIFLKGEGPGVCGEYFKDVVCTRGYVLHFFLKMIIVSPSGEPPVSPVFFFIQLFFCFCFVFFFCKHRIITETYTRSSLRTGVATRRMEYGRKGFNPIFPTCSPFPPPLHHNHQNSHTPTLSLFFPFLFPPFQSPPNKTKKGGPTNVDEQKLHLLKNLS